MTPFDYGTATADEVLAEAQRRKLRRELGLPLDDEAAERREQEIRDTRLEKQVQQSVREVYLKAGCRVRNLSQARPSKQSPGLADLFVVNVTYKKAWWHESKRRDGVWSDEQQTFAEECRAAGIPYIIGDADNARQALRDFGIPVVE